MQLSPSRLHSCKGMSSVEVMILFAVTCLAVMLMAPFVYRHFQGYFFFDAARSMDRQFDPYDAAYDSSASTSQSVTDRQNMGPMPNLSYYSGSGATPFDFGGMEFQFDHIPRGAVLRESTITKKMTTTSSGTGDDKYDYQDRMQPVY